MEKSATRGTREFTIGDETILWEHLKAAYEYDVRTNSLKTHRRLTEEHFNLSSAAKMRNHLADDVLGEDMLELMLVSTLTTSLEKMFISLQGDRSI